MAGNTFGKFFRVTTFGESHSIALGCVIDGCPSGISLSEEDFKVFIDRRRTNNSDIASKRNEKDEVKILSGILDGKTLGTPICVIVYNNDLDTSMYDIYKNYYRPGHADYTYYKKYGIKDYRNGGRASGRETISRVIAGALAIKILKEKNITIKARGDYDLSRLESGNEENIDFDKVNDSIGGIIECVVKGCEAGLGEPVFDKLDAELAKACMSIGAIKGVEIGAGFEVASMLGSECNDMIYKDGKTKTNNSGGILGGISNGNDIIIRMAVKPTPTISKIQNTIDINNIEKQIEFGGRNDICIVERLIVVVECMVALTIYDAYLQQKINSI